YVPNNKDTLCLARSLVTALYYCIHKKTKGYFHSREEYFDDQMKDATALLFEAGVSKNKKAYSIDDLKKMMDTPRLNEYGVKIVPEYHRELGPKDGGKLGQKRVMFKYSKQEITDPEKWLYLLYMLPRDNYRPHQFSGDEPPPGHYGVIKLLSAYFSTKKYCKNCDVAYNMPIKHTCPRSQCHRCRAQARYSCEKQPYQVILCADCRRTFYSRACFESHRRCDRASEIGKSARLAKARKRKRPSTLPSSNDGQQPSTSSAPQAAPEELKLSTCQSLWICGECHTEVQSNRLENATHPNCGLEKCPSCKQMVPIGRHKQCYMKQVVPRVPIDGRMLSREEEYMEILGGRGDEPVDATEPSEEEPDNVKMIYADFECTQTRDFKNKKGKVVGKLHEPNLCVAQKVCDYCVKFQHNSGRHEDKKGRWDSTYKCPKCNGGIHEAEKKFSGEDTGEQFVKWLLETTENKKAYVIFHNGSSYDFQIVLQWLIKGCNNYELVPRGRGIMLMKTKKNEIKFVDSLHYLPMSLAKLQKTFNLEEGPKMDFPHLANTWTNWEKELPLTEGGPYRPIYGVGNLPPLDCYSTDRMTAQELEDFKQRRLEKEADMKLRGESWILHDELYKYCSHDVTLVRAGFLKYRSHIIELTGFDPLVQASTLASTSTGIFRTDMMTMVNDNDEPRPIALVPVAGYTK
ncbi:MAG: hypothetical protein GY696_38020, partial [Gammaproteobacteria bacterium]|nr:hypothetical protein [Gammaproteobacteria bacterium]